MNLKNTNDNNDIIIIIIMIIIKKKNFDYNFTVHADLHMKEPFKEAFAIKYQPQPARAVRAG